MQTNIGNLVVQLFSKYEHLFSDQRVAAVATSEIVNQLREERRHDRWRVNGLQQYGHATTRVRRAK